MKYRMVFLLLTLLFFMDGCQKSPQACPPVTGTPQYLVIPPHELPTPQPVSQPVQVEIGQKPMQVDKLVEGPLCNDSWDGTVYVACNVQVYPWEEHPTFLKDCKLDIEPGTVVYVAYHNNTAYYNGCSCHTGATPEP